MIHLYALARDPVLPGLPGVDGAPVETVTAGDLHANVSHHDADAPATTEAALAHAAVIEELARRTEVLPVRFGPARTDVARLRTEIDRARPELTRLLDRVGGHVEFVLRPATARTPVLAGTGDADDGAHGPGRSYLEGRRAAARAASEAQAAQRDHLRRVSGRLDAAASAVEETTGRTGPERCFLVARGAAVTFASLAREVSEAAGDLVIGGPWPPFTFASLAPDQLDQR